MINWQTNKPIGAIILAKLKTEFCDIANGYEVLYKHKQGYYYGYDGEEIPNSAIEKWALIEN